MSFHTGVTIKGFFSEPSVHKGKADPMGMHCTIHTVALDLLHFIVGGGQAFLFNHSSSYSHVRYLSVFARLHDQI